MRRRDLLYLPAVLPSFAAMRAAPPTRPNVLLLVAHGWRARASNLHAPNLERLARESLVFNRYYVCCPEPKRSLDALMTGRFPVAARAKPSLSSEMQAAGYEVLLTDSSKLDSAVDFLRRDHRAPYLAAIQLT